MKRSEMKLRRSLLVLAALTVPALACGLIVGIDDHDFTVADAGFEAAVVEEAPAPPPPSICEAGVGPPGRPSVTDGENVPALTFAVHQASLRGLNAAGDPVGVDLDRVCTCDPGDHSIQGGQPSCVEPAKGLRPGACDEDGGIDDTLAYIFGSLPALPGTDPVGKIVDDGINKAIACGKQTLVYVIDGYNGTANDPDVVISAYLAVGIYTPHDGGVEDPTGACAVVGPDGPYPARFDGTDVWYKGSDVSYQAASGWVRDFQLVLDNRGEDPTSGKVLPLLFADQVITLGTPVMSARLVPLDENGQVIAEDDAGTLLSPTGKATSFRIEQGIITGRASSTDVLSAVGNLNYQAATLCPDPVSGPGVFYCLIKKSACSAVDTMKLPNLDFHGQPCDALSMVLQFDAVPAVLASQPRPVDLDGGLCPTSKNDSCDDTKDGSVNCGPP
jgi:hypothetical protein